MRENPEFHVSQALKEESRVRLMPARQGIHPGRSTAVAQNNSIGIGGACFALFPDCAILQFAL